MDVRETTELDEDERIITIADGSDTGIVNAQVPEADIIRYKDSTYEIVSKIAYLIGVPKRIFENEHEPPKMEVYERLEQDKAARIIRHLCIIRTAIERNFKHINEKMRFDYTSIYNLPEYIPPASMTQLSADGVNFVRKSSKKLCHHVIEINKLIADRINNCKKLFPLWLNWQYVKNLFVMPNGLTEDGTKAAADIYYSHLLFYPYQVYINWTPKEEGNILYNDKKFVTLLYQWNNDYFTEYSKVSDAGSYVKGSIYEFIESSEKVVIVVDCENSDPYKLCATLRNLDRQYMNVILNTAGFRMEARFEAFTAKDHVKLSRILRQITHRHNLAVLFFQRDRFAPVAAERQIKGGIVLKGDCHCLNRNGELLHPLHMGGIVQLNEVASDGIALYALDLNRVGKDGITGLLMVKLPHFVFVGILHIDFTLRQEVSAVRTGHPEKVLVLGGLGTGKAVKQPSVQLKVLFVVLGVDVHNPAKGIHKIDVFKLHRHHSKPTSRDFCLTGVFRSGWLFAAARSCSRIEGFSRAAS